MGQSTLGAMNNMDWQGSREKPDLAISIFGWFNLLCSVVVRHLTLVVLTTIISYSKLERMITEDRNPSYLGESLHSFEAVGES